MTKSEADRIHERLDRLDEKIDEVRDWMHEQRGGRKAFYSMMLLSATVGGAVVKLADLLLG